MSFANSYAKALYDTAESTKATPHDQLEAELKDFAGLLGSTKDLRNAMATPSIPPQQKVAALSEITKRSGYSPLSQNFLNLLARKGRLSNLSEIIEAFRQIRIESQGGVTGIVVSADPLDPSDIEALSTAFGRKFGKKVIFRDAVDPELMAGMKVTVQGVTYDGSLRAQLKRLRERLVYGSRSI